MGREDLGVRRTASLQWRHLTLPKYFVHCYYYYCHYHHHNNKDNAYGAVIITTVHVFCLINVEQLYAAADSQTEPTILGWESTCRLLVSPSTTTIVLFTPKAAIHFATPQSVEVWVDLNSAVRLCSPRPRPFITVAIMINTTVHWGFILSTSHTTDGRASDRLLWHSILP